MSTNLVSSIMQLLTPDLIARIASALGLERSVAQKAIAAGVPAILAGLASLASKPGGAQQLSSVLARQRPDMLDTVMTSSLTGSARTTLSEEGSDQLSSLLGRGGLNGLMSAISTYTGMSQNKSETLLGLLAPMVMGAIGQQQRKAGVDSAGLVDLLTSQKSEIAAALPSGFVDHLGDSGYMDMLDRGLRTSAESASGAAGRVGGVAESGMGAASRAASTARTQTWPFWLAGVVALLALGWYFLGDRQGPRVAEQTTPAPAPSETVGRGTPDQMAADLNGQLTTSVGAMRNTLQDITDAASAQAAMPKLQQMSAELDKIGNATMQLPPEARKMVASQLATSMPAIDQLCERVLAIPGVAGIAKPLIDSMREKLGTMARA